MFKFLIKHFLNTMKSERGGGSKPQPAQVIQMPAQPPAPSATESAESIYQARAKYDPLLARQQYELQQEYMPKQTALEYALYSQYYPQLALQQQALQRQLYPQQAQILEAGAGQALQQLQQPESALLQALQQQAMAGLTPTGYTPEQQTAVEAIRGRETQRLSQQLRERANLGGTLYGGRAETLESRGLQELGQRYSAEDIDRLMAQRQMALATASGIAGQQMQARQLAQAGLTPYMQILYPQVGTQQPQFQPFQYQSAVPSPDALYNALYGAGRRDYALQPAMAGQPSPAWGMAGQAIGIGGGIAAAAII